MSLEISSPPKVCLLPVEEPESQARPAQTRRLLRTTCSITWTGRAMAESDAATGRSRLGAS